MDTTLEYILMCEKATEIQALRKLGRGKRNKYQLWKEGDAYFQDGRIEVFWLGELDGNVPQQLPYTWLPLQHQLQDMMGDFTGCLSRLYWWQESTRIGEDYFGYNRDDFDSMEQFWLAIVMCEKYNKVWDSERKKWVGSN